MLHDAPITSNYRLQHRAPAVGTIHVARPQGTPLDIAELIEHKQRVVTGTGKVAIVGAAFLLTIDWTFTRIHVEHDGLRRSPPAHLVDPLAGQIRKGSKVLRPAQ